MIRLIIFACSIALTAGLLIGCGRDDERQAKTIRLYAGAGLRPVIEELADVFGSETGVIFESNYAGSGMLISRAKLDPQADLFMPGDLWYLEQIEAEGLVQSKATVCYFVPVIMVRKGNPKNIQNVADLFRDDVRVGLGQGEVTQIGRITEQILVKNGLSMDALNVPRVSHAATVNELGLWVDLQKVDAALVWDAVAAQYPDSSEIVNISLDRNIVSHVAIGVMKQSVNPELANQFVEFLQSDRAREIFTRHQYRVDAPQQ